MSATVHVEVTVNGERARRRSRRACCSSLAPRRARAHRHARRLRHHQLRRLHRPPRRRRGEVLHGARRPGRRRRGHDHRGPGRATASCTRCRRPSGSSHGLQCGYCTPGMIMAGGRPPRSATRTRPRRRSAHGARGQPLPLHRLPQHRRRRCSRRRRGVEGVTRIEPPYVGQAMQPQGGPAADHRARRTTPTTSTLPGHAPRGVRALARGARHDRRRSTRPPPRSATASSPSHRRGHGGDFAGAAADGLGAARASRSRRRSTGRWRAAQVKHVGDPVAVVDRPRPATPPSTPPRT